jgi:pimeloyl-ACP methyl ester carboxylesterase
MCPDYPRAYNEVYVCLTRDGLKLDQKATLHNPVNFVFPPLPAGSTIEFDAGDGNGPVTVLANEVLSVTYASPGQYNISWVLTTIYIGQTGTELFQTNFNNVDADYADFAPHESWGDIVGNTYTPDTEGVYPNDSPYALPVDAGGIVHVLYANPDHQMRKPFVFVEGFDPVLEGADKYAVTNPSGEIMGYGSVRWDVIMTGRTESFDVDPGEPGVPHNSPFQQLPALIQELRNRGYDIVFVDFADAGTYIQANAEFLIDVLERVNNAKITDETTVLVGASMGGIVSRYALAKMESEGKTHCVGLFGTLDTPHNGANIPLSLQALSWFFHASGTNHLAWNAMDTPAARQQLIQHIGTELQAGNIEILNADWEYCTPLSFDELTSGSDYAALRNELKSDFASIGWPQQPRKIAMIDGMKNGTLTGNHGYGPGDLFYDGAGEVDIPIPFFSLDKVFKILMRSSNGGGNDTYSIDEKDACHTNTLHVTGPDKLLFAIAKPSDFDPCNQIIDIRFPYKYYMPLLYSASNLLHLDNAPGGLRLDLRSIHDAIKKSVMEEPDVEYLNPVKFPIYTFVPTWSALAMGTELTNENLFVDLTLNEYSEDNLPGAAIPHFDNFYAPTTNLRHVELDAGMVSFLLTEIDRADNAPRAGILFETYNYGDKYKNIPNTVVSPTGILNINNTGPTGYLPANPLGNAVKPVFTTYLNSCGQNITVENGGRFHIGALDKSQHGITEAWDGATVHIKAGGTLHITSDQSMLRIKNGAKLILDPGAIVRLESPGSRILIEGELIVNGDFVFAGLGYFDFSTGNQLVFGPGYNTFNLLGATKTQRFVRLSADVTLDQQHRLNWRQGLLEVGGGTLRMTDGSGLQFTDMTLTSGDNAGYSAISANGSGRIDLLDCDVSRIDVPVEGNNGIGCTLTNCAFSDYTMGVYWTNAPSVSASYTTFDGSGTTASAALNLADVALVLLNTCQFTGHDSPVSPILNDAELGDAIGAVNLDNTVACLLEACQFNNNTIGVKADNPFSGNTANVFAYDGSSFTENKAAIYVVGDQTRGTVLADCVLFDRNINGIRGRDITLMIDGWNSKTFAFDTDSPNRFLKDNIPQGGMTDKHVRICYEQKAPGGSNLMRNNFWGIFTGGVPLNDPQPQTSISLLNPACNAPISMPVFTPFGSKNPICTPEERPLSFSEPFPGSECMLLLGNGGPATGQVRVHEQFHLGTYLMRADSVEAGIEAMRPVAALWQQDLSAFTDNCQQYIRVAKAFVDASDNGPSLPRPGIGRNETGVSGSPLLMMPNPAVNSVLIYLPDAPHTLRVWDTQGRLLQSVTANGVYRLDLTGWARGIYLIEAIGADGSRKSGKLVAAE